MSKQILNSNIDGFIDFFLFIYKQARYVGTFQRLSSKNSTGTQTLYV